MLVKELSLAGALICLVAIMAMLVRARAVLTPDIHSRSSGTRVVRSKLDRSLMDAGAPAAITASLFRLIQLGSAALCGFIGFNSLGIVFAVAGVIIGFFLPGIGLKVAKGRRQRRLDKDMNQVLQTMQMLLVSGTTLDAAIQQIANSKSSHNIYQKVFQQMAEDIRASGGGKQFAFDRAQTFVNNPIFDRFVGYLRTNDELGVELIPLLKLAQEQIRAQTLMMGRLQSAAAQTKLAGYFIPIMMGGGLLLLQIVQGPSSYWGPLFTFPGNVVELFAYGMFFAGGYFINRLQQVPPTQRMFYRRRSS